MFKIKIISADIESLVGSIWETDGITAKCIYPAESGYVPGFEVKAEVLGFYRSERLFELFD